MHQNNTRKLTNIKQPEVHTLGSLTCTPLFPKSKAVFTKTSISNKKGSTSTAYSTGKVKIKTNCSTLSTLRNLIALNKLQRGVDLNPVAFGRDITALERDILLLCSDIKTIRSRYCWKPVDEPLLKERHKTEIKRPVTATTCTCTDTIGIINTSDFNKVSSINSKHFIKIMKSRSVGTTTTTDNNNKLPLLNNSGKRMRNFRKVQIVSQEKETHCKPTDFFPSQWEEDDGVEEEEEEDEYEEIIVIYSDNSQNTEKIDQSEHCLIMDDMDKDLDQDQDENDNNNNNNSDKIMSFGYANALKYGGGEMIDSDPQVKYFVEELIDIIENEENKAEEIKNDENKKNSKAVVLDEKIAEKNEYHETISTENAPLSLTKIERHYFLDSYIRALDPSRPRTATRIHI